MTMPKGLMLRVRKKAFARLIQLESKVNQRVIADEEICLIQERWLKEGDLNLTAFKIAKIFNRNIDFKLKDRLIKEAKKIKTIYEEIKDSYQLKDYSPLTKKRYASQLFYNPQKVKKQFYPTYEEENKIRKEWKEKRNLINYEDKKKYPTLF